MNKHQNRQLPSIFLELFQTSSQIRNYNTRSASDLCPHTGVDPGIFERGGPEAIIYKILERGGPKSLKMAFECSFQSFSNKSFANIPQKGGGGGLGPSSKSTTVINVEQTSCNLQSCFKVLKYGMFSLPH